MNLVILSVLASLFSAPAFSYDNPELDIRFISWCEDNKVMTENSQGEPVLQKDCDVDGLVCKAQQIHKPRMTINFAICDKRI